MMNLATYRAKHAAAWLYQDRGNDFDPVAFKWFRDNGVDHALVTNMTGPVVRLSLDIDDDGHIVHDELGGQCLAFAITAEDAETEIDVVAFAIREPERFGTFLGQAGLCGTSAVLNPASFCSGPCPLWATPLQWLQAGCAGACVIDAEIARPILSRAPGKFLCESWSHAEWLVNSGAAAKSQVVLPKLARAA